MPAKPAPAPQHFQSPQERSALALALSQMARVPKRVAAAPWEGKKQTPASLFTHLCAAARDGREEDLDALLALGAPLSSASGSRNKPEAHALISALGNKRMGCARKLMERMERESPKLPANERQLDCIASYGSAELLLSFCHAPWPSAKKWLDLACSELRIDLVEPLAALAGGISSEQLDELEYEILDSFASEADLALGEAETLSRHRQSVELIAKRGGRFSPELTMVCFREAVSSDSPSALRALLEAGLKPSAQWSVRHEVGTISLLAYAYSPCPYAGALPSRDCLALLSALPVVGDAARTQPPPPGFLKELKWAQLKELEGMGMAIDAVDGKGENVAHAWARGTAARSLPQLISLCQERPNLIQAQNKQGKSALDLALNNFPKGASAQLFTRFLNNEKKQIKALAPAASAKPATRARARL